MPLSKDLWPRCGHELSASAAPGAQEASSGAEGPARPGIVPLVRHRPVSDPGHEEDRHGRATSKAHGSRGESRAWTLARSQSARRSSDRAEAVIVALLVAAFLIGTPLIALTTWRLTFNSTFTTTEAAAAGGGRPRPCCWPTSLTGLAVTVHSFPSAGPRPTACGTGAVPGRARCAGRHQGDCLDRRFGASTCDPDVTAPGRTQADLAAAIAVPVWALTLLCAGMACRHVLDHRRLAAWEADWRTLNFSGPAGASPDR